MNNLPLFCINCGKNRHAPDCIIGQGKAWEFKCKPLERAAGEIFKIKYKYGERKMSSEFLEDVECNGTIVLLTMMTSGFANLTILEPDEENKEGDIARFPLIPNKAGLENAEKIASALKSWAEHIKTVGLLQEEKE